MHPVKLKKSDDRSLVITWSDDVEHEITFRKLRENCCCANCIEKRMEDEKPKPPSNALPVLSAAETRPLDIDQMHPVGNYAYNIHFSDGHSAGIFPFEMLRSLGDSSE